MKENTSEIKIEVWKYQSKRYWSRKEEVENEWNSFQELLMKEIWAWNALKILRMSSWWKKITALDANDKGKYLIDQGIEKELSA